MNDIPSPLSIMLVEERLENLKRERASDLLPLHARSRLQFPPLRRTIGLTLIRAGRVLASMQLNGV